MFPLKFFCLVDKSTDRITILRFPVRIVSATEVAYTDLKAMNHFQVRIFYVAEAVFWGKPGRIEAKSDRYYGLESVNSVVSTYRVGKPR